MKKVLISLMLLAGVYWMSFSQQETQNQTGSQRDSSQNSHQGSSQSGSYSQGQGSSLMSQNSRWEKIGQKTIDLRTEGGVLDMNTDREKTVNANDVYSEIKFRCTDVPVDLTNVEVLYDNGQKEKLTNGSLLKVNSESKALTLNSRDKLDKITFDFNKNNAAERYKANIEVWGLKANSASGMGQSSRSDQKSK